jgi:chromosome segregation ATPase
MCAAENNSSERRSDSSLRDTIDRIHRDISEIFKRIHTIETEGCLTGRIHTQNIKNEQEERKSMKAEIKEVDNKIDCLKNQQAYWSGGLAVLVIIAPILVKIFWS